MIADYGGGGNDSNNGSGNNSGSDGGGNDSGNGTTAPISISVMAIAGVVAMTVAASNLSSILAS